jgi:hypothetical protein
MTIERRRRFTTLLALAQRCVGSWGDAATTHPCLKPLLDDADSDRIPLLCDGRIADYGMYAELMAASETHPVLLRLQAVLYQ